MYPAGHLARVDGKTVHRWIVRYETKGAEGFLLQERNRVYSPELKQRAVEEYLSGVDSRQAADRFDGYFSHTILLLDRR